MKPKENIFDAISTEIIAGKRLFHNEAIDKEWNKACDRASRIVQNYKSGNGLFQPNYQPAVQADLICDLCYRKESAPFAEGDECSCGGNFFKPRN